MVDKINFDWLYSQKDDLEQVMLKTLQDKPECIELLKKYQEQYKTDNLGLLITKMKPEEQEKFADLFVNIYKQLLVNLFMK